MIRAEVKRTNRGMQEYNNRVLTKFFFREKDHHIFIVYRREGKSYFTYTEIIKEYVLCKSSNSV